MTIIQDFPALLLSALLAVIGIGVLIAAVLYPSIKTTAAGYIILISAFVTYTCWCARSGNANGILIGMTMATILFSILLKVLIEEMRERRKQKQH